MKFDILSIFPEMFNLFTDHGIIGRAVKREKIKVNIVNIRDFGVGPHLMTDDRPFGGGDGMVMKPEPIFQALESIPKVKGAGKVLMLTPQGQLFNQSIARDLCELEQIILVCGRYEGVDERITKYIDMEISIGDYVLSGGELPAMIIMEAVSRLIPGVLGGAKSNLEESFENHLLEYPQYTRPRVFQGDGVPSVLLSGNHEKIKHWRKIQSIKRTLEKRPDLLKRVYLNDMEKSILEGLTSDNSEDSAEIRP